MPFGNRCLATGWQFRVVLLLVPFLSSDLLANEPGLSSNWRRYREGPLTVDDFRAPAPAFRAPTIGGGNVPLAAYTLTEIRYDLRFQITGQRNRWTAKLIHADAFAVVLRDRSWNLSPRDEYLMDHEQGHFDLTHSFALAVQIYLNENLKQRRLPVGLGTSTSEATRNLENKLRAELQSIFDEHVTAQTEYDRLTGHGTILAAQVEQRKLQLNRIADLDNKLAAARPKSSK